MADGPETIRVASVESAGATHCDGGWVCGSPMRRVETLRSYRPVCLEPGEVFTAFYERPELDGVLQTASGWVDTDSGVPDCSLTADGSLVYSPFGRVEGVVIRVRNDAMVALWCVPNVRWVCITEVVNYGNHESGTVRETREAERASVCANRVMSLGSDASRRNQSCDSKSA